MKKVIAAVIIQIVRVVLSGCVGSGSKLVNYKDSEKVKNAQTDIRHIRYG
jgi:hypothetical protein